MAARRTCADGRRPGTTSPGVGPGRARRTARAPAAGSAARRPTGTRPPPPRRRMVGLAPPLFGRLPHGFRGVAAVDSVACPVACPKPPHPPSRAPRRARRRTSTSPPRPPRCAEEPCHDPRRPDGPGEPVAGGGGLGRAGCRGTDRHARDEGVPGPADGGPERFRGAYVGADWRWTPAGRRVATLTRFHALTDAMAMTRAARASREKWRAAASQMSSRTPVELSAMRVAASARAGAARSRSVKNGASRQAATAHRRSPVSPAAPRGVVAARQSSGVIGAGVSPSRSEATRARCRLASPHAAVSAQARFMNRWRSCSSV